MCVDLDDVARANLLCALGRFAVHEDECLFDELLNPGTGKIVAASGDYAVEALTSVGVGYGQSELGSVGHVESVARESEGMVVEGGQKSEVKSWMRKGELNAETRRAQRKRRDGGFKSTARNGCATVADQTVRS